MTSWALAVLRRCKEALAPAFRGEASDDAISASRHVLAGPGEDRDEDYREMEKERELRILMTYWL